MKHLRITPRTPAIPSYQFIVELYCDKMIRWKGQHSHSLWCVFACDDNCGWEWAAEGTQTKDWLSSLLPKSQKCPLFELEKQFEKLLSSTRFDMKCGEHRQTPLWKWHARMNKRFECTAFDKNERERDVNGCLFVVHCILLDMCVHCTLYALFGDATKCEWAIVLK